MTLVRSFLALPVPEALRAEIRALQEELGQRLPGVRWAAPRTVHLTLRFFGAIPEEDLAKIGEVMLSVGRLYAPFELPVEGVGAFPSPHRARVLWLGLGQAGKLLDLQRRLDGELARIGYPGEERPFHPHLTLGRSRQRPLRAGKALKPFLDRGFGMLPVASLVLYESRLQPEGAVHLPRHTAVLHQGRP